MEISQKQSKILRTLLASVIILLAVLNIFNINIFGPLSGIVPGIVIILTGVLFLTLPVKSPSLSRSNAFIGLFFIFMGILWIILPWP